MPIKGNPTEIRYKGAGDIMLFNQFVAIKLENKNSIILLPIPNKKANKLQVRTAFNPLKKSRFANCSDTIEMQARFRPEVASVIANIYTDMTKSNTPTASEPILFDT